MPNDYDRHVGYVSENRNMSQSGSSELQNIILNI